MPYRVSLCLLCLALPASLSAAPLQTFTVRDYLSHDWRDELVHFDFNASTSASDLTLADAQGRTVLCQFTGLKREKTAVAGQIWTVVSVPSGGEMTLQLILGKPLSYIGRGGNLVETIFLPRTADYSYSLSTGGGNQEDHRHVLPVKSDDPLGANYVPVRDSTVDG